MALSYDAALVLPPVEVTQAYTERDTILYALGIGLGADPLDKTELAYVYERGDLKVLPTMPVAMAFKSLREMNLGIDYSKLVHGEQSLKIHRPMPTKGVVLGRSRVVDVIDRGKEKGALVLIEREITDETIGELLATVGMTGICRGDGGFGGPDRPMPPVHALPQRAADIVLELPTSSRAALIYRLSGDYNPLHIDPAAASAAGFERPILHGLATFGMVGWAVIKGLLGGRPEKLMEVAGRFSSPVYPGDTLRVELWRDGNIASARASAIERGNVVFNNGRAVLG
jgi:acyl dehydratase